MKSIIASLLLTPLALAADNKPNILLICIDDLRPELPAFGKSYIHAPNIEKLAQQGRLFKRHYVQAPTCGSSRYGLLVGRRPKGKFLSNNAIVLHDHKKEPSFPAHLRQHGYYTVAIGKVSHYPCGHSGHDWKDLSKPEMPGAWDLQPDTSGAWKTPKGQMHGTANGQPRVSGKTPALEALDASYPDDPTISVFKSTFATLEQQKKPWLCAVGLLRPHLPFACPKRFFDLYKDAEIPEIPANKKPSKGEYWHSSGEFMKYVRKADPRKNDAYAKEVLRYYAACVSYADHCVGEILQTLEKSKAADNTIVILWGDHGWHLGEHKIWGKHSPYAVALHSPLIVKMPHQQHPGVASNEVVETVDLYPSVCEWVNTEKPAHLQGASLTPIIIDPKAKSDGLASYHWNRTFSTITATEHLIKDAKSGKTLQRYDLEKDPHETTNLAK